MKSIVAITTLALALPAAAQAATRGYDTRAFDAVSAAGGITVEITLGPSRSVVAETRSQGFDDLRIEVEGNTLRIDRPKRSWFSFGRRPSYHVRVATPVLRSLSGSSGSEVSVKGTVEGDFKVEASSGSEVEVASIKGRDVQAHSSSGSDLKISGSCVSLEAEASSGSDLDADRLQCEQVSVKASSGSDVSVEATRSIVGSASSGSDVRVRGRPSVVEVDKSSGADVVVRN